MKSAALVVLALTSSAIVFAEALFKGTVTDASGAPISRAMILVHWDSAGSTVGLETNVGIKQDFIMKTDDRGRFEADLPPGFYDVFVSAMAFTPVSRKIRIRRTPTPHLTMRMDVDPLVMMELGDPVTVTPYKR